MLIVALCVVAAAIEPEHDALLNSLARERVPQFVMILDYVSRLNTQGLAVDSHVREHDDLSRV